METRYIRLDEAADYLKISAASFIWKFDEKVDNSVDVPVLGAFSGERLVAGAEIYDLRTNYCGEFLNAVVPSGICSLPEARRMGGVREIFKHIAAEAPEKGWVFGFLRPFSISCYEKFGYANLNRVFQITVPFENLQNIPRNTDVVLYTGEQFAELSALHAEYALTQNLISLREDKKHFCDKPLEEADYTYFRRDKNGKADGYVRFRVNRPDRLVVQELFCLTPAALYGLIGFLRNYDGIVGQLVVKNQYQGSPFACVADRIDKAQYEYNGGVAGRIYNMQKLLEANAYPEKYGGFSLLCRDEIEQNNGIFAVEYQNGKAQVTKKASGSYDIALAAPAAARLLLAGEGHTAQTAAYINGVEINGNANGFFCAFPHRMTCFTDSAWST